MKHIVLFLLMLGTYCAQAQTLSETDLWKLSWRMYISSMEKNYELGELQFDSLLATKTKIDKKLVLTGLEIFNQRNDLAKVSAVLQDLDSETLSYLCEKSFIHKTSPDFIYCTLDTSKVTHPHLQLELVKMYIKDQAVRDSKNPTLITKYNLKSEDLVNTADMPTTDAENRTRLKAIIAEYGFPTKKMVGTDGMQGVFFIIQHSLSEKDWQRSQLANIELAVKRGDLDGQSFAYLYDRIKIGAGEKQLYGTQFIKVDLTSDKFELGATEDPDNLDKRRMEVGMMPIDAYKKFVLISMRK